LKDIARQKFFAVIPDHITKLLRTSLSACPSGRLRKNSGFVSRASALAMP